MHMPTLTVLVISTHTPHTGCDFGLARELGINRDISTHTPHTGCDDVLATKTEDVRISTHTPHTGCDAQSKCRPFPDFQFQLTHPTRGATSGLYLVIWSAILFQLTHPTRGATDSIELLDLDLSISTHTPHTGCDYSWLYQ